MLARVRKAVKEKILDKTEIDDKFFRGVKKVKKEYKKTLVTALTAGLAFIIALYIRDVLKIWIEHILEYLDVSVAGTLISQSVIALVVVGLCVLGIIFLSLWQVDK